MTYKNKILGIIVLAVLVGAGYYYFFNRASQKVTLDSTPQKATLSGTYVCLPHLDSSGPQTEECAFGLKTDDGVYYAVGFGQSINIMEMFQSGSQIKAEGLIVTKESLSTNQWAKYNMKGIFTIKKMIDPAPAQGISGDRRNRFAVGGRPQAGPDPADAEPPGGGDRAADGRDAVRTGGQGHGPDSDRAGTAGARTRHGSGRRGPGSGGYRPVSGSGRRRLGLGQ